MRKKLFVSLLAVVAGIATAFSADTGSIGAYTLTPAAGTVEEISTIKIDFPGTGFMGIDNPKNYDGIRLTGPGGKVYSVVSPKYSMGSDLVMSFAPQGSSDPVTITTPGTYTLTIAAGTFNEFMNTSKTNGDIEAKYIIPTPKANELTKWTLSPAEGKYASLGSVTVEFPDAMEKGIAVADLSGATLALKGGATYKVVSQSVDKEKATLGFGLAGYEAMSFKRPGIYTLTIPKEAFCLAGDSKEKSGPISATYEIENPQFDPMLNYVTSPIGSQTVESLSEISIEFPEADLGLRWPVSSDNIILTNENSGKTYKVCNLQCPSPYRKVIMKIADPSAPNTPVSISESADYTLSIPAGTFAEDGSAYSNSKIELEFKILNPADVTPFTKFESDPAPKSTKGEFQKLSITFPDVSGDGINWPFDAKGFTLQHEGDTTVYYGNTPMLSKGKTIIIGFGDKDKATLDQKLFRKGGKYTVTIATGTLWDNAAPDKKNRQIRFSFFIDPALNFTYSLTPDPKNYYASIPAISVEATDVIKEISLNTAANAKATLTSGDDRIELVGSNASATAISFSLPAGVESHPGEWKLTIPAGMISAMNADSLRLVNPDTITAVYKVRDPEKFTFTTDPAEGSVIPLFSKFTVNFDKRPSKIEIDEKAGTPVLVSEDKKHSYELAHSVSGGSVAFAPKGGTSLADGKYTVSVPAGFLVTRDSYKLTSPVAAINATFSLKAAAPIDFNGGLLIYNEGWFGNDNASFNYVATDGKVRTNIFAEKNPTRALGVTGQYASRYGDRIYAVAKQSGANISGVTGGVLTAIDATTMAYDWQINDLPKKGQAHAFCAANASKGYLSTSKALYPVDLEDMKLGEALPVTKSLDLTYGEMQRYGKRVYAVAKNWPLIAIDTETDKITEIETGPLQSLFVTRGGDLWCASNATDSPFVRVDTATFSVSKLKLKYEGTEKTTVADSWNTWRKAPIAPAKDAEVVFYATSPNASRIARLDLNTGDFNPEFVVLPKSNDRQQIIYGEGVSVDPATGEILITAVESGYGTHYRQNFIYRADPATGKIIDDKTVKMPEYYWFPACMLYTSYKAPEISLEQIDFGKQEQFTIDMPTLTSLPVGNKSLIRYSVTSSNPRSVGVDAGLNGRYTLRRLEDGTSTVTLTAEFIGLTAEKKLTVSVSGVETILDGRKAAKDVYTSSGILIVRNATQDQIDALAPGLYIIGGKKVLKR